MNQAEADGSRARSESLSEILPLLSARNNPFDGFRGRPDPGSTTVRATTADTGKKADVTGNADAATRFDTIRTERLIMRRWRDSDRAPFAALNGDPETLRFFPETLDRAASDAFVDRIEARFEQYGYGLWALEVTATGQFIGFAGFSPVPDDIPGASGMEIGWRLARHAWHNGYATEAARAALTVAFGGAGLPEVWSFTSMLNEPSMAVMRRIGMTEAGRFDNPRVPVGDPLRPHVLYHLSRPEAEA